MGIAKRSCGLVVLAAVPFLASPPAFRGSADLVLVNTSVLDPHNRPVRGLSRSRFRLFEDNVEQSISSFSEEEVPASIVVLFDTSASMERKMSGARDALAALLRNSNADDEFSLITFADRPELAVPWTADPGELQNQVLLAKPHGLTSLLDAVALGVTQLRHSRNSRRALLILSDGGDNRSRHSPREIFRLLEESDIELYGVDLSPAAVPAGLSPEEQEGPGLLNELCDRSGGHFFHPGNAKQLADAAARISEELRSAYVLGYTPLNRNMDGRFRRVQLRILPVPGSPKLSAYWRRGYRAPDSNRTATD